MESLDRPAKRASNILQCRMLHKPLLSNPAFCHFMVEHALFASIGVHVEANFENK
jgi:hypothetical protein